MQNQTFTRLLLFLLLSFGTLNSCKPAAIRDNASTCELMTLVEARARSLIHSGLQAGDGYGEVWIRDFNTFMELALHELPSEMVREALLVFFRLQAADGNIVDGFIAKDKANGGYDYVASDLEPRYLGNKNTSETDQESSLIQAVYKYIVFTKDHEFLNWVVGDKTVAERLQMAIAFPLQQRFDQSYGLIWSGTTADFGDVQPEDPWGVLLTNNSHHALSIYANAMFLIALKNLSALLPARSEQFSALHLQIATQVRQHLWDSKKAKFIPHVYLKGSPFPATWDENQVYYHGGTAVAIEADLLSQREVALALTRMRHNVKAIGATTIGLALYPAYPEGFFLNASMLPYHYQNGGDWTWFGGRMIQQLVRNGFITEACNEIRPMLTRVEANDGFFEWYTLDNKPQGSGSFRGEAGVLFKAIKMLNSVGGCPPLPIGQASL